MAEETRDDFSPLETVRQVLIDEGLPLQPFRDEGSSGFIVSPDNEFYQNGVAHILEEGKEFLFYVDFRQQVPEQSRAEVAEFITRANHQIFIGNFEMDYEEGRVCFKSGLNYDGTELSYNLVRNAVVMAGDMIEFYGPALLQVVSGIKTAADAIIALDEE